MDTDQARLHGNESSILKMAGESVERKFLWAWDAYCGSRNIVTVCPVRARLMVFVELSRNDLPPFSGPVIM